MVDLKQRALNKLAEGHSFKNWAAVKDLQKLVEIETVERAVDIALEEVEKEIENRVLEVNDEINNSILGKEALCWNKGYRSALQNVKRLLFGKKQGRKND